MIFKISGWDMMRFHAINLNYYEENLNSFTVPIKTSGLCLDILDNDNTKIWIIRYFISKQAKYRDKLYNLNIIKAIW